METFKTFLEYKQDPKDLTIPVNVDKIMRMLREKGCKVGIFDKTEWNTDMALDAEAKDYFVILEITTPKPLINKNRKDNEMFLDITPDKVQFNCNVNYKDDLLSRVFDAIFREQLSFSLSEDLKTRIKKIEELFDEILKNAESLFIRQNLNNIKYVLSPSVKNQEYVIEKLGPRGILLINNPDPELLKKYNNVKTLNKAGIF